MTIRDILKGIDREEADFDDGWWETSTGVEFGAKKLAEVEAFLESELKQRDEDLGHLEHDLRLAIKLSAEQAGEIDRFWKEIGFQGDYENVDAAIEYFRGSYLSIKDPVADFSGQLCCQGDTTPFFHTKKWLISDIAEKHNLEYFRVLIVKVP